MHAGEKLETLVEYIGYLLGAAHARGALALKGATGGSTPSLFDSWSKEDIGNVMDHAVQMAGIFETVYLAYVRRQG